MQTRATRNHGYLRLTQLRDHPSRPGSKLDDFPNGGPIVNELGGEYTLVRKMAIEDRRIVRYRNGVYMFVPPCGSWLHIRSPESARYMANMVGLENVTINYTMAADMYLSFAEKVAPSCRRVLEPVKLLVFGMHTQSPKSFYRDVTNKKRNLILCCSTTLEII